MSANFSETNFLDHPPRLTEIHCSTSVSSVSISWTLEWGRADNPLTYLHHHAILRRREGFSERAKEFRIKPAAVASTQNTLRPRFEFVDCFEDESNEEAAKLPPEGRTYAYTITPVDIAGHASPVPFLVRINRSRLKPP